MHYGALVVLSRLFFNLYNPCLELRLQDVPSGVDKPARPGLKALVVVPGVDSTILV